MKVLIIEDSERLRRSLAHGLARTGFAVDVARDGHDGLAHAANGKYDVVVLDLMLPGIDGLTVLRRLRRDGNNTHVLILSARDRVADRIEGLDLGADDYLIKPFEFDELVARIRSLVRRKFKRKNPIETVGSLQIDICARSVTRNDLPIDLTRHEFTVLEYLVARRGRIVSKPEILDHLYAGTGGSENAVEVFIHQLRKKIHRADEPELIRTRRGHGYLIEA